MTYSWGYFLFATLAVSVAYIGVISPRNTARIKSSSSLLHSILQDMRLEDAFQTIKVVHRADGIDLVDFASKAENDKTKLWLGSENNPFRDKGNVRYVDVVDDISHALSYYDFVASGIKRDVYDEEVLKDCLRGRLIGYWDVLEEFVIFNRNEQSNKFLWQELEVLVQRWKEQPLPKKPTIHDFDIGFVEGKIRKFCQKLRSIFG